MSNAMKIFVPKDSAAKSVGADDVATAIAAEAKKQGKDVEIIRTGSRGMFWLEPLVEVECKGGRMGFGPLTAADIPTWMDGTFSDKERMLGMVEDIPFLAKQERLTFARCGIIDPVSVADYTSTGGYEGLGKALKMTADAIVTEVTDSGLRGRGGAGFPAGIKWRTVMQAKGEQKYICCNADEGDSGTYADRMLMEGDPLALIEGMTIAAIAVGATKGFIYIRSEYPDAIATMQAGIVAATAANWLGANIQGSGKDFVMEVRQGAGAYICGEETSMLDSLEGLRGMVRAKPPLPALEGLFGKPTVVNNVLTLAATPTVLAKGAAYYKDFGVGRSRGTQPFQLAGNIKFGGLVEKAFGITLRELIYEFGGGTRSGKPIRAVQVGGPLGAYLPEDQLDLAADYEVMAGANAMLGHGGIVVFDETADMANLARFAMEFCSIESCGKCTPCRIGSTRGIEVIDKIKQGENRAQNVALLEDLCQVLTDGSLCAMGGLTPMPVLSALKHFPGDFGLPDKKTATH